MLYKFWSNTNCDLDKRKISLKTVNRKNMQTTIPISYVITIKLSIYLSNDF